MLKLKIPPFYFLAIVLILLCGCDLEIKTKNDRNDCFLIEKPSTDTILLNKCTGDSWMLIRLTGDEYDKYEWLLIPRLDTPAMTNPLFPKTKKSK